MPKLPILSGKEMIKLLRKIGFSIIEQKGSHIIMQKFVSGKQILAVVPNHPELKIGTLISIMKQAQINRKDLEKLLK